MKPEQSLCDLQKLRENAEKQLPQLPPCYPPSPADKHAQASLQPGSGWRKIIFLHEWAEVEQQVLAFAPHSGWLAWQLAGLRAFASTPTDDAASKYIHAEQAGDVILQAELASACGQQSLHLQMLGDERWRLAYFSQAAMDATTAEKLDTLLFSELRHVGKHGVAWLQYQIWWQFHEQNQWQQIAARLQSLEMHKDGEKHAK